MTKFSKVFSEMTLDKMKFLNRVVLLNLLAIVITAVIKMFTVSFDWPSLATSLISNISTWALIFMIAFVAYLIWYSMGTYRHNRYRLIPISDGQLTTASILSTTVSLLYVTLIEIIMAMLSMFIAYYGNNELQRQWQMIFMMSPKDLYSKILVFAGFMLLMTFLDIILLIVLVNFVNFLTNIMLDYLPSGWAQTAARIVLYIVVFYIVIEMVQFAGGYLNSFNMGSSSVVPMPLVWNCVVTLAGVLIFGFANGYLLRYVETKR